MLVAHMQALKRKSGESKPHLLVAHQVEGVEDIEKDDGPDDNAERRSHDSRLRRTAISAVLLLLFSSAGFDGKGATDIAQGDQQGDERRVLRHEDAWLVLVSSSAEC